MINNEDLHNQIKHGVKYSKENLLEDTETNKTSTVPKFMPQILLDDEITKGINSLNSN